MGGCLHGNMSLHFMSHISSAPWLHMASGNRQNRAAQTQNIPAITEISTGALLSVEAKLLNKRLAQMPKTGYHSKEYSSSSSRSDKSRSPKPVSYATSHSGRQNLKHLKCLLKNTFPMSLSWGFPTHSLPLLSPSPAACFLLCLLIPGM